MTGAGARHVFLSGPMGAGKSTVGPLLARELGVEFVDLDASLERETGMRIAEIFRSKGEATFRRLETDLVHRLVGHDARGVFALGGGTVEDAETRAFLLDRGVLVTLTAPIETLAARALREEHGVAHRPLLAGDAPVVALARIVERRAAAYAEAHRVIDTSGVSPADVARSIAARLSRDEESVVVRLGRASHRVVVQAGARRAVAEELAALRPTRLVVVTDEHVALHVADLFESLASVAPLTRVVLEAGEVHKTLRAVERIWDAALSAGVDRDAVVVAIGGGVVGDVAGFAAATLLRGVRWVQVPTSLLAMVDSSVGGKTGVDRPEGKNLVGAFRQPSLVLADPELLATLPARELRAGLAEVVKAAWLEGEADVVALERDAPLLLRDDAAGREARTWAIRRAVRTKARIVAADETETGVRRFLNLGHTLGHAVEAASGYALVHGEAVAIGLVATLRLGVELGRADPAHVERLRGLLEHLGLPTAWPPLDGAALRAYLAADKKNRGGEVRFIAAGKPGDVGGLLLDRERVLSSVDAWAAG